jgi:serine/threonine-protein kinase RsbT
VNGEIALLINSERDILSAREKGRWLAEEIGFRGSDLTLLSTLISELARKVLSLDCKGNVEMKTLQRQGHKGIAISITDNLSGMYKNIDKALVPAIRDRLSRDERLLVLAGRRVADEFVVRSDGQTGAVVRVVKWL